MDMLKLMEYAHQDNAAWDFLRLEEADTRTKLAYALQTGDTFEADHLIDHIIEYWHKPSL